MEFKTETLFDKFDLSTELSSVELLKEFQINPKLRPELPRYIKIIKDPDLLAIEKAFSTYVNGKHFNEVELTKVDLNELNPKEKLAFLLSLIKRDCTQYFEENNKNSLFMLISNLNSEEVSSMFIIKNDFLNFCSCLKEKIKEMVRIYICDFKADKINGICNISNYFFSQNFNDNSYFLNLLIENLIDIIDKLDLNEYKEINNLIWNLDRIRVDLFKVEPLFKSVEFFLVGISERKMKEVDYFAIIKVIAKMIKISQFSSYEFILRISNNLIDLTTINDSSLTRYDFIKDQVDLILKKMVIPNDKKEDFNSLFCLRDLTTMPVSKHNLFRIYISNLKQANSATSIQNSIFSICYFIAITFSKDYYDEWLKQVTKITDYDKELTILFEKVVYSDSLLKILNNKIGHMSYTEIVNEYGNKILLRDDVDNFLYKYYPLVLLGRYPLVKLFDNLINKTTIFIEIANKIDPFMSNFAYASMKVIDFTKDMTSYFPLEAQIYNTELGVLIERFPRCFTHSSTKIHARFKLIKDKCKVILDKLSSKNYVDIKTYQNYSSVIKFGHSNIDFEKAEKHKKLLILYSILLFLSILFMGSGFADGNIVMGVIGLIISIVLLSSFFYSLITVIRKR